jgi:hypothetical protein
VELVSRIEGGQPDSETGLAACGRLSHPPNQKTNAQPARRVRQTNGGATPRRRVRPPGLHSIAGLPAPIVKAENAVLQKAHRCPRGRIEADAERCRRAYFARGLDQPQPPRTADIVPLAERVHTLKTVSHCQSCSLLIARRHQRKVSALTFVHANTA